MLEAVLSSLALKVPRERGNASVPHTDGAVPHPQAQLD